ncbi:hypothetical protein [Azospirillum doebereinerae]
MRHEHAPRRDPAKDGEDGCRKEGGNRSWRKTDAPAQEREAQKDEDEPDGHGEKAGDQGPEGEAHFPDGPEGGRDEDKPEQGRARWAPPNDLQSRNAEEESGEDEVPASAEGGQLSAADHEERSRQTQDSPQEIQPERAKG